MTQNTDLIENPLNTAQLQRAAALMIAKDAIDGEVSDLIGVADYIVGDGEVAGLLDFALAPFTSEIKFDAFDVDQDVLAAYFGCDTEDPCDDCPFAEGEAPETVSTVEEIKALPVGTLLTDKDSQDFFWAITEEGPAYDGGSPWPEARLSEVMRFGPFTVVSRPEPEPEAVEEKPAPLHAVGDHLIISARGGERIGRPGKYLGKVTKVVDDVEHDEGGVRYYETTLRPYGVWENFVEYAPEYLCDNEIEGALFVHDEEGLDALPAGAVIETASGYVGLVVLKDGELGNTRSNPSEGGWRRTVLSDMANGHPFRVVHVGGSGI